MSKDFKSVRSIELGPLPVEAINRTIGTQLQPGSVIFSRAAQIHAAKRHPNDYERCKPFVGAVIGNPLYVGDDFKNGGKIELVARISALGQSLLVAVNLERDLRDRYHICSVYPVTEQKIQARREKGYLFVLK